MEPINLRQTGVRRPRRVLEGADELSVMERVDRDRAVSYWHDRFGVPDGAFDGYVFYMQGKRKIWAVPRRTVEALEGDGGETLDSLDYETVGLPFVRVGGEYPKPTTDALQRFGDAATRNVVGFDDGETEAFVSGDDVEGERGCDRGYVVARHGPSGAVLGCGLYIDGVTRSMVPKARRVELVV